jgi:NAD(P)-dependent dehydrogenase (short-subunit alcohol dehydrogenase family)
LFDKVVALNFKGPFRLSALAASRMAKADGGCIINISSTASLNPSPASEPYGAAKAALNSITRSFAFAYGPKVRVNCIVAGPFLTDISKAWDMEAFERQQAPRLALKRGGEPNEVVGAALYLASASASFTSGTLLRVDGGTP